MTLAQLFDLAFGNIGRFFKEIAFKTYTMESVHGYLTNLRMQHCRRAIAAGASVLDACNASGFTNYTSFLKTFRSLYGITPSEYRNQLRRTPERVHSTP